VSRKLLKFYGHFAAAFGTLVLAMLCAGVFGWHFQGSFWFFVMLALSAVHAAERMRKRPGPRTLGRYGSFAAALGTAMFLVLGIVSLARSELTIGPVAFFGMLALCTIYSAFKTGNKSLKPFDAAYAGQVLAWSELTRIQWAILAIPGALLGAGIFWQLPGCAVNKRGTQVMEALYEAAGGGLEGRVSKPVYIRFRSELQDSGRWEEFVGQYPFVLEPWWEPMKASESICDSAAFGPRENRVSLVAKIPDARADWSGHTAIDQHVTVASVRVDLSRPSLLAPWRVRVRVTPGQGDWNDLMLKPVLEWLAEQGVDAEVVVANVSREGEAQDR